MIRALLIAMAALAAACQGPPTAVHDVRSATAPCVELARTLAPLEAAFDAHADVPRVVVLLPARCEACACGLAAVQASILEAFPSDPLHVFVVLPGDAACDACGAPAAEGLFGPRVTVFRDLDRCAARAFARGLLPVSEASDMFLFYPSGLRWHDAPVTSNSTAARALPTAGGAPRADQWWHRLGRIAPDRHCAAQELDATLRQTMAMLLGAPRAVAQQ